MNNLIFNTKHCVVIPLHHKLHWCKFTRSQIRSHTDSGFVLNLLKTSNTNATDDTCQRKCKTLFSSFISSIFVIKFLKWAILAYFLAFSIWIGGRVQILRIFFFAESAVFFSILTIFELWPTTKNGDPWFFLHILEEYLEGITDNNFYYKNMVRFKNITCFVLKIW